MATRGCGTPSCSGSAGYHDASASESCQSFRARRARWEDRPFRASRAEDGGPRLVHPRRHRCMQQSTIRYIYRSTRASIAQTSACGAPLTSHNGSSSCILLCPQPGSAGIGLRPFISVHGTPDTPFTSIGVDPPMPFPFDACVNSWSLPVAAALAR